LIETVDQAEATTSLSDISFASPIGENSFFGVVHWRVGRNSIIRNLRDVFGSSFRSEAKPIQAYRVTGSGGGRWFSWTEHFNIEPGRSPHPGIRRLYVEGTSEPFTIYGVNPEYGGDHGRSTHPPFMEIVDSANVRLLSMKSEANGIVLRVSDSRNIFFGMAFINPHDTPFTPVQIIDSADIEMHAVLWPLSESPVLEEIGMGETDFISRRHLLGIYQRGNKVDWSSWN